MADIKIVETKMTRVKHLLGVDGYYKKIDDQGDTIRYHRGQYEFYLDCHDPKCGELRMWKTSKGIREQVAYVSPIQMASVRSVPPQVLALSNNLYWAISGRF